MVDVAVLAFTVSAGRISELDVVQWNNS
jgi:hypothetical protein